MEGEKENFQLPELDSSVNNIPSSVMLIKQKAGKLNCTEFT